MVGLRRKPLAKKQYHKQANLIVDGAYVMKSCPERIDYLKLRNFLSNHLHVNFRELYYFNSVLPTGPDQSMNAFLAWLRVSHPAGPEMIAKLYTLKERTVECLSCKSKTNMFVQAGVDTGIATLIAGHQNRNRRIVLVAGDCDFIDAVNLSRNRGSHITVCAFSNSLSNALRCAADSVLLLDGYKNILRKDK